MKASNDSYQISLMGSFRKVLQRVGVISLWLALPLGRTPQLWGQCQQAINSLTFNKGSIIALTMDSTGLATWTVTLNCPWSGYPQLVYSDNSSTSPKMFSYR